MHKAINRQGKHLPCRLPRLGDRRAAPALALMIGGGHQASHMKRSAIRASSCFTNWLGWAADAPVRAMMIGGGHPASHARR